MTLVSFYETSNSTLTGNKITRFDVGKSLALGVGAVFLVDLLGDELTELGLTHTSGDIRVGIAISVNAGGITDISGSPFAAIGVTEWVERSVDVVLAVSSEGESWCASARGQSDTRVGSLVHGGQTVDVGVVQPEERIEG